MKPSKRLCCILLIPCAFIGPLGIVQATTESLNIDAGKELVCKINDKRRQISTNFCSHRSSI